MLRPPRGRGRQGVRAAVLRQSGEFSEVFRSKRLPIGPGPPKKCRPGHPKLESSARYLVIEIDDALSISEQVELEPLNHASGAAFPPVGAATRAEVSRSAIARRFMHYASHLR